MSDRLCGAVADWWVGAAVSCVQLGDEDVIQVVGKTVTQQKHDKNYAKKVQAHYDAYKAKKKKAPLKS